MDEKLARGIAKEFVGRLEGAPISEGLTSLVAKLRPLYRRRLSARDLVQTKLAVRKHLAALPGTLEVRDLSRPGTAFAVLGTVHWAAAFTARAPREDETDAEASFRPFKVLKLYASVIKVGREGVTGTTRHLPIVFGPHAIERLLTRTDMSLGGFCARIPPVLKQMVLMMRLFRKDFARPGQSFCLPFADGLFLGHLGTLFGIDETNFDHPFGINMGTPLLSPVASWFDLSGDRLPIMAVRTFVAASQLRESQELVAEALHAATANIDDMETNWNAVAYGSKATPGLLADGARIRPTPAADLLMHVSLRWTGVERLMQDAPLLFPPDAPAEAVP